MNRLTQSQHFLAGSSPKFNYGYDEMSNRKYEQRNGTLADGFGYDVNNQLASFRRDGTFSGGSVSGGALNTLAYDASGNRTSMVENGATTTYAAANNLNQYPTVGGLGATYDGNGNLKTFNGWTYTYDAMNRLTAASKTGASATFHYDGLNRQITRNFNGNGLVYFSVWAGWDLVEEYSQGDALYASYLQGAKSDELISMTRSGQAYYFFQDGRGNTSQVANSSGALVETCKYDVHGEPAITVAPGKTATGNRFLFTGREYYQSLGLYNYRNRFYSPEWGRFLQPDPIGFAGDPANLYRYCGNNSVNRSDANGLIDNHKPMPPEYVWDGPSGGSMDGGPWVENNPDAINTPGALNPDGSINGPDTVVWPAGDPPTHGDGGPTFSSLASDPSVSFRNGNSPFGNGGRGRGGHGHAHSSPTISIDPKQLVRFAPNRHLARDLNQLADGFNAFAYGAVAVVAVPVLPVIFVEAPVAIGTGVGAAASGVAAATSEIGSTLYTATLNGTAAAALYAGVVVPVTTYYVNNPEVRETMEEIIEESKRW